MKEYQNSFLGKLYDTAKYVACAAVLALSSCSEQEEAKQKFQPAFIKYNRTEEQKSEPSADDSKLFDLVKKLVNTPGSNYPTFDAAVPFVYKTADENDDGRVTVSEYNRFVESNKWINDEYEISRENSSQNNKCE
jgi:hypothetical protein